MRIIALILVTQPILLLLSPIWESRPASLAVPNAFFYVVSRAALVSGPIYFFWLGWLCARLGRRHRLIDAAICSIIFVLPVIAFHGAGFRMSDRARFAKTFGTFPVPGSGFTAVAIDLFKYNSRRTLATVGIFREDRIADMVIINLLVLWLIFYPVRVMADLRIAANRIGPVRRDGFMPAKTVPGGV